MQRARDVIAAQITLKRTHTLVYPCLNYAVFIHLCGPAEEATQLIGACCNGLFASTQRDTARKGGGLGVPSTQIEPGLSAPGQAAT